ncbi:MAG: SMI1/KNR4 family protein, partial [Candidatus Hydrogenedentales bacterium]
MLPQLDQHFPKFASMLADSEPEEIEYGKKADEIQSLEDDLGIPLPDTYKRFLSVCSSLWLFGGAVQFGSQHPFYYDFPPLEAMNPQQLAVIKQRGGNWPPPSQGMLCFAEYF